MHQFVYFNEGIYATADAHVDAVSPAALYGRGIFTTIAIRDGQPFLWERHWVRLQDNASRIGLDISGFREGRAADALAGLIERNAVVAGLARITFFDERKGSLWPADTVQKTSLLITTRDPRQVPQNLKLTVSPYCINTASPLAGVKSCNYLENLLGLEEARERGFDEAVRLNERGEIAGACMANVFWERDGTLYTPSLASGCLAGTTRAEILESVGGVEMDARVEVLDDADAIFLTSAGLGKVRVAAFGGRKNLLG